MSFWRIKFTKSRIIYVASIVIALLLCYFFIRAVTTISRLRTDLIIHSDKSLLNASIREALREYYYTHGCYPENVQLLREPLAAQIYPLKIPNGPNVIDHLREFEYHADGDSYTMTWEAKQESRTYTHKERGQNGELVGSELYIDGRLSEGSSK